MTQPKKLDKFHRRCCYNCAHHLDYHMEGDQAETVVCSIRAQIPIEMGGYIGIDYNKRISADHAPCNDWEIDTNVPKGFKWGFQEPKQLSIDFEQ